MLQTAAGANSMNMWRIEIDIPQVVLDKKLAR